MTRRAAPTAVVCRWVSLSTRRRRGDLLPDVGADGCYEIDVSYSTRPETDR